MANMAARLGNVLFWASLIIGALAGWGSLYVDAQARPVVLGFGAAVILIGWALRYVLTGYKTSA
jgi:uncharacterized membrane protein YedE/YeeE